MRVFGKAAHYPRYYLPSSRTYLKRDFPGSGVRAFADDTAMVLDDIEMLPYVLELFETYATFSNLKLNLKKQWSYHYITPIWKMKNV